MNNLAGIQAMALILCFAQRQGAAQAVGVVLAVLLRQTVHSALFLTAICFPLDIDVFGIEVVHEAHK